MRVTTENVTVTIPMRAFNQMVKASNDLKWYKPHCQEYYEETLRLGNAIAELKDSHGREVSRLKTQVSVLTNIVARSGDVSAIHAELLSTKRELNLISYTSTKPTKINLKRSA